MPLSVEVGGETSSFERAMARAQAVATVTASEMKRRFTDAAEASSKAWATSSLGKVALAAAPFAAAAAAVVILGSALKQANDEFDKLIDLEAKASSAGVGVDFARKFLDASREMRLEVEGLQKALQTAGTATKITFSSAPPILAEMTKLFGEFSDQVRAFNAAPTSEARFVVVAQAIKELISIGQNLAAQDLAEKFLGKDFAENLRRGRVDVDAMVTRFQEAAAASGDTAKRAQELADRLTDAQAKIKELFDVQFTLIDLGWRVKETWVGINEGIANAIATMRNFQARMREATGVTPEVAAALGIKPDKPGGGATATKTAEEVANDRLRAGLQSRGMIEAAQKQSEDLVKAVKPDAKKATPAAKETEETTTAVERYTQQLQKANAEAQTQAEFVGKTNAEYQVALVLARARVAAEKDFNDGLRDSKTLTAEEVASMTHLAEVTEKAKTAARQFGELQQFTGHLIVDSLMSATEAGAKFSNIMADVTKSIARAALNALILGQGPLAGLFGTGTAQAGQVGGLLGSLWNAVPKFQEGGVVPGSGPRMAVVHGGEVIIPPDIAKSGVMGGSTVVSISQSVDARGAQIGVADQIAAALSANNKAIRTQLPGMIRDARSRSALT